MNMCVKERKEEICVKITKKCLMTIACNRVLACEELETLLMEIEGVLNFRPFTYACDELDKQSLLRHC